MLAAELLITFVIIKNIQMYVGICEMLIVCNLICIWFGKNTESWNLWNLIQDIKQTSDPSVWMPGGAWSMTFSSVQGFAILRPGVKLDGQFHLPFHTSLPLPWKPPVPESYSTFLLWPPDLLCLEMAMLFPTLRTSSAWVGLVAGKDYGGVQSRVVTATSVTLDKLLPTPKWTGALIHN